MADTKKKKDKKWIQKTEMKEGAFTAKAKKNPRKSIFWVFGSMFSVVKVSKSKVPVPSSRPETT